MRSARGLGLWLWFSISLPAAGAAGAGGAEPSPPLDSTGLALGLERLQVVGSALYIAAHPDDENTALLAWLARGRGVRTAYLSLTRGDGGQNLVGNERGAALGVLRTEELVSARSVDGAEQWFTCAIDFGFTKSREEALTVWGQEQVLADVVWVIRRVRPDIILTRFRKDDRLTHGQHSASALLAEEAFAAAADPARFPEQLAHVRPWRTARLFHDLGSDEQPSATHGVVTLDLGTYLPLLGRSCGELAALSQSRHASQAMGTRAARGPAPTRFELLAGEALPEGGGDLFAGLDLSWKRLAGGGERVGKFLADAAHNYRPREPAALLPALFAATAELDRVTPEPWVEIKRREIAEAVRAASGLWLEATANRFAVSPGGALEVTTTVIDRAGAFRVESVALTGAVAKTLTNAPADLAANVPVTHAAKLDLPASTPLGGPYWLQLPHPAGAGTYRVDDQTLRGLAAGAPALSVRFTLTPRSGSAVRLTYDEPVVHRFLDPKRGERYRPLDVVPEVSLRLDERVVLFPDRAPRRMTVTVAGAAVEKVTGKLTPRLPKGFAAEPEAVDFALAPGEERALTFILTPPPVAAAGRVLLEAATARGVTAKSVIHIDYPHVPLRTLLADADAALVRVDLRRGGDRLGYVMGSGDDVPAALRQAGYDVELLSDSDIERGDLARFDAIVIGIRAYNVRPRLRAAQSRLLEHVVGGGTLVVQYQVPTGPLPDALGPYPFKLSQLRVTREDAAVRFALADHPALHAPNDIGPADFDGWVQERGLYFADTWDARYQTPLACHDPGEDDRPGGLLVARHGKGTYVYTGYAFFRQLPAGVPGAYRLFANLLDLGRGGREGRGGEAETGQ